MSSSDKTGSKPLRIKHRLVHAAALCLGFLSLSTLATAASPDTRSLKIQFIHTGEKAEIVFKRNGRYDPKGLQSLNRVLRDWRRNEPTEIDPMLFDLVWEVYRSVGATGYINVVSAYRSPETNEMLRSTTRGVAKTSQHRLGKAMDFFIPGVPLKTLRETAMKFQVGGVGYYPTSGSPFVHLDVARVRAWPRMSRQELVRLFPDGKTLHIPADGRPLPGYEQAVAEYRQRIAPGGTLIAGKFSAKGSAEREASPVLTAMLPKTEKPAEQAISTILTSDATRPSTEKPAVLATIPVPRLLSRAQFDEGRQAPVDVALLTPAKAIGSTSDVFLSPHPASTGAQSGGRIALPSGESATAQGTASSEIDDGNGPGFVNSPALEEGSTEWAFNRQDQIEDTGRFLNTHKTVHVLAKNFTRPVAAKLSLSAEGETRSPASIRLLN
ncbi:uncharacterized protein YcbK (DUF882 family) [Rhizobium borbori]|uniref:Murein endopeptidase K n=1 Tax=Allorhizobium borbori TaxID=485907 RepID=A0A7W6K0U8_9HYPH|nr:uncharacterized protein YcbK (DUF882 family) [Allorhizobium borbori]